MVSASISTEYGFMFMLLRDNVLDLPLTPQLTTSSHTPKDGRSKAQTRSRRRCLSLCVRKGGTLLAEPLTTQFGEFDRTSSDLHRFVPRSDELLSLRYWFIKSWFASDLQKNGHATRHYLKCAIEMVEWAQKTWRIVPDECASLSTARFLRTLKIYYLQAYMVVSLLESSVNG